MTDKFLYLGDTSVEYLKQIANAMQQYVSTENEAALQTALDKINQKPDLMARLFPTVLEKEKRLAILQRMRSMGRANEELFDLYTKVQLEIARIQGDALVASVGVNLQKNLTAFVTEKIGEITKTFIESKQSFMEDMRSQIENIESYKDIPRLYQPSLQSLDRDIKIYYESIFKLQQGFIDALERKVESYRK